MENNQTTQQQSSDSSCSALEQPRRDRKKLASSDFLLNLIICRPWLLWIGVGAFLFSIIYISLLSITQTGFVKSEPTSVVTENPEATQTDNSVPLWLLGAVIVGGAGAIAIAKRLPSSSYLQFFQLRVPTKALTRREERKLLQGKQQMLSLPVASEQVTETVSISVSLSEDQSVSPEQIPTEEEIIILLDTLTLDLEESAEQLLPEEEIITFSEERSLDLIELNENNSLAASTQSLVEMLDLRYKIPLSTLLSQNSQLGGKN